MEVCVEAQELNKRGEGGRGRRGCTLYRHVSLMG